jgi:uncharacterized tellurite resistance protein B-like protein
MEKIKIASHWDEKYLITFLYTFLAQSDFVVNAEEALVLKTKINNLLSHLFFMSEADKSQTIEEVNNVTNQLSESEKMDLIEFMSNKVELTWDMYEFIINDLNDIAKADQYISVEEHSLMYYVRLKFNKDYLK